jgi:hypothetical protein
MTSTSYLVLMLIWPMFESALGVVQLATQPGRSNGQAAIGILQATLRLLLVALTAMQIGGGT